VVLKQAERKKEYESVLKESAVAVKIKKEQRMADEEKDRQLQRDYIKMEEAKEQARYAKYEAIAAKQEQKQVMFKELTGVLSGDELKKRDQAEARQLLQDAVEAGEKKEHAERVAKKEKRDDMVKYLDQQKQEKREAREAQKTRGREERVKWEAENARIKLATLEEEKERKLRQIKNREVLEGQIEEKSLMKLKNSFLSTRDWQLNQSLLRDIADDQEACQGELSPFKDVIMEHIPAKHKKNLAAAGSRVTTRGGGAQTDLGHYQKAEEDKLSASMERFAAVQERRERRARSSRAMSVQH